MKYVSLHTQQQQQQQKKKNLTKNQDVEFFTYIIYIIYSNVITLFWDGFKTITYKSELLFSFFT